MNKIKYLEGLRGVAALIVVFSHLRNACFSTHHVYLNDCIDQLPLPELVRICMVSVIDLFVDGKLAVWIFWVLSSYVMSILFFKWDGNYDKIIIGYFSKRYIRLFVPVLAAVFFAYVLLKCGFMFNAELAATLKPSYSKDWLNYFYNFEPNAFVALRSAFFDTFFKYDQASSYNAILWTIQNEFIGSLFIFSLFGIIRHNKRRYLLYFIIAVVVLKLHLYWLCAFVIGHVLCDYDFSNTDDKFIIAIRKAESGFHKNKMLIFILSLLLICLGKPLMTFGGIQQDLQNLVLSSFIVYSCCKNACYQFLFSRKLPFWLGNISFSLYLIHLPVICSLTSYLIIRNNSLTGKLIASLITLITVLMLAPVYTKYIDKKGMRYANKIGDYFKRYS
jgi:peptidoglycan/LPS O-acetylase OafA/YrhL